MVTSRLLPFGELFHILAEPKFDIGALLEASGLSYADIVKTTIFLKNMDDFPRVNEIYGGYFKSDFPARETVEVSRLPKDALIEISVIAMKP